MTAPPSGPAAAAPSVILLAGASPHDRDELAIDAEFDAIEASIRLGSVRGALRVVLSHDTETSELVTKMLDDQPAVVHFSGHGTEYDELVFVDASGAAAAVDVATLEQLFSSFSGMVRCVVLNACYSSKQADALARHVDCVIGMIDRVSDAASQSFATSFYRSLADGRDIATAFDLAVVHVDLAGIPEAETPALFGRERAAMLRFDTAVATSPAIVSDDAEQQARGLYDEHYLSLVRLASTLVDSVSVCEGIVQEAFVRLLTDSVDAAESALSRVRRLVLEIAQSRLEPHVGLPAPPSPAPVGEAPDEVTAVLRAIRTLASSDASALVLEQLGQLSADEIAATLGVDSAAVASALSSAVAKVTSLLEQER